MKKIFKYKDFYATLLLEANIKYEPDFGAALARMSKEDEVAKTLQSLQGKDVDVNTNYIDISIKNPEIVKFRPDDKVEKAASAPHPGAHYLDLSRKILGDKYKGGPKTGQAGVIEREIPIEEAGQEWRYVYASGKLVVFKWRDEAGEGRCVFDIRNLETGKEAVKPSEIGVGRFARAILKKAGIDFKDTDIENFVYRYRLEIAKLGEDALARMELLSGKDIKAAYLYSSYETTKGTLGASCMRYSECQDYLDIYVENPDVCKLLVMRSEKDASKICARALVWTDTEGRTIVDRIYTNSTPDEIFFKEWARKNSAWHKQEQNSKADALFVSPSGEVEELKSKIKVKGGYDQYPYVDTFKYFSDAGKKSYLTNDSFKAWDYMLEQTDGTNGQECTFCGGESRVDCPECEGNGNIDCEECGATGRQDCGDCDGKGHFDCANCGGEGTQDGEDCGDCGGSGTQDCEECRGEGSTECGDCDGRGHFDCDFCNGRGTVHCPEC